MKPKDQHKEPTATGTPLLRHRFRIQKLEERIAPRKGGGNSHYTCTEWNCTRKCG